jgi:ABC-type methionine transport system permease subunit
MRHYLSASWGRLRRTLVFTVVLFSFTVTILVGLLMVMSLVYGEPVRLYFNEFGERALELGVLAVVVGTMPFVLLVIDESLREQ